MFFLFSFVFTFRCHHPKLHWVDIKANNYLKSVRTSCGGRTFKILFQGDLVRARHHRKASFWDSWSPSEPTTERSFDQCCANDKRYESQDAVERWVEIRKLLKGNAGEVVVWHVMGAWEVWHVMGIWGNFISVQWYLGLHDQWSFRSDSSFET